MSFSFGLAAKKDDGEKSSSSFAFGSTAVSEKPAAAAISSGFSFASSSEAKEKSPVVAAFSSQKNDSVPETNSPKGKILPPAVDHGTDKNNINSKEDPSP